MGRTLQTPTPTLRNLRMDVPINKGGTGVKAASQLPAALGIVGKIHMGAPNGVAKAGMDGLLPANQLPRYIAPSVTIDGPEEVFQGQTVVFTITNYDVKTSYNITVSAGTVSRSGKDITFVAPNSVQNVTMFVNGRACSVPILASAPSKPSITAPVYGAAFAGPSYTFLANAYAGSALNHTSSDWQIATDANFTDIRYQTLSDAVNKTSWALTGMTVGLAYLVRVRYRASDGAVSSYSDPVLFTLT